MMGWSRGGMMTHLALKRGMEVNAAVIGAGESNIFLENKRRPEMEAVCARFIPRYETQREAALKERSVAFWPEKIHAPLLLLHGDSDVRVDVGESRRLYQQLTALGKPVKYIEFANGNHGLTEHRKQVIDATVSWFEAHKKRGMEKKPLPL